MDQEYAGYLLQKTKQDYNVIAEEFSRTRWDVWAEFSFFRNYVKDGDSILDIGCGNGRLLQLFEGKNIDYLGLDNSEKLIAIAKEKYPSNKFLVAEALHLPFPADSFDKVFLIAVLHHIPSAELRQQALREIKRILKLDGLLFLTVWDIHRKEAIIPLLKYAFLKLIRKSRLDFKDVFIPWGKNLQRYYHFFTRSEVTKLIKHSGLKIEKLGIARNETGRRSNMFLICRKD